MKFDENNIITFDNLWLEDDVNIIIENIEYVTKILNAKRFDSAIPNVPPVINNWIRNRFLGVESDKKLMEAYNNFFIAYKDWLLYFKNDDNNISHQNKQLISNILYCGPIYRLICSGYDSNHIDVIRNDIYVSWSSIPIDDSNPMYSYMLSKMYGQVKYLESEIVNDFGINLDAIKGVRTDESEVVYPTTKNLNIKEHIIDVEENEDDEI